MPAKISTFLVLLVLIQSQSYSEGTTPLLDPVLGVWSESADGVSQTFQFNSDGTFTDTSVKGDQSMVIAGTYVDDGSKMTMTSDGGTTMTVTYVVSGNTMTVSGSTTDGTPASMVLKR